MDLTENYIISDVQKLLHPELLPRNELLEILESRCVQQQLLEGLEKCQLVDLFQRIVMPLPQRTYKNKRRGKLLNESRSQKERHLSHDENLTSPMDQSITQYKLSNAKGAPVEQEKMANRCSKNSLDHIIIKDRRKMPKIDDESSNLKDTTRHACDERTDANNKSHTVVKLKRRDTNSSEKSSTSMSEDEAEDKKKRRRIVWP